MNKELQDQYIYDYLEGNLSKNEEGLFHELLATDEAFKKEYEAWQSTYFMEEEPVAIYAGKEALLKKTTPVWRLLAYFSVMLITGSIVYYFSQDSKVEDNLIGQQGKSNVISNNQPFSKEELDIEDISQSAKSISEVKEILPKKNLTTKENSSAVRKEFNRKQNETVNLKLDELIPINLAEKTLNSNEEEVESLTEADSTIDFENDSSEKLDSQLEEKIIVSPVLDGAPPADKKTMLKAEKEKKKLVKWREIKSAFKRQKVVPMD